MCSILGYYNSKLSVNDIKKLNFSLSHRGPDNSSVSKYFLNNENLFLGHNRLAIQDLDSKANQPMENDRYALVFNGEIYNHMEIRKTLTYNDFQTHSDTETIIWAFAEYGIKKTISLFIGMFENAIFEKKENKS